jgi:hypothetical protein
MKGNITLNDNYAVSEVVGGMVLIVIAVLSFTVISLYLWPSLDPVDESIKLQGYVTDDGTAVIEHVGGQSMYSYRLLVNDVNGTLIGSKNYRALESPWEIGECIYPLEDIGYGHLVDENDMVRISVYNLKADGDEYEVFDGILTGNIAEYTPYMPMLISSLRTDTPDEDLTCYTYSAKPDINATTYIYNWKINNQPIAEVIMPFDTNSNTTTKDYSGNGLDGLVRDCEWIENGIVGGAYRFGGSKEHIVVEAGLPPSFSDIANNDFTISIWVNSSYMNQDNKIILEIRNDTKNYIRLYQEDDAFNFGVCVDKYSFKESVKTGYIQSNIWYHVAAVWDADQQSLVIYVNGVISTERGDDTFSCGSHTGLSIGHGNSGSGGYWYGYLDEVEVYNRVLSGYQIYQIYISQKDGQSDKRTFVSEETNLGEIWQCFVTPNDGTQDGTTIASNTLQIVNYPGGE